MKCLSLILSLLLAVLAACTRPAQPVAAPEAPQHDTLAAFDTLMQSQPDSAFGLIYDFYTTRTDLTPLDRRYADLLLSEALFKNDYEQTLRTEVQQAQAYFDSLAAAHPVNDDFTLPSARSHYMNGVGLVETDSTVEACAEYLKALEIMENRFDEKELVRQKAKFMALTYNRLGELFSDHLMTEQALACFKESMLLCEKYPTSKYGLSRIYLQIGVHFDMLNQPDSSIYYYDKAMYSLPDTCNRYYRDVLSGKTLNSYVLDGKTDESIKTLSKLREQADTDDEKAIRDLTRSEIFYKEGLLDSAQMCLENVFQSNLNFLYRIQAAKYLQDIHAKKGEESKADIYAQFLAPLAVESYEQKNKDSQMVELFRHHHQSVLQKRHITTIQSYILKSIVYTLLLLFFLIPLIIYLQRRKHQRRLNVAMRKFESEQQQSTAFANNMQKKNKNLESENQRLVNEMKSMMTKRIPNINDYNNLLNESICRNLRSRFLGIDIITTNSTSYYAQLSLSPKEERELTVAFEKHCPDFTNRIATLYPDLKKTELKVCRYTILGLTEPQIAVLLQKDYTTLWRNINSLKKKMNCIDVQQHLISILFADKNFK